MYKDPDLLAAYRLGWKHAALYLGAALAVLLSAALSDCWRFCAPSTEELVRQARRYHQCTDRACPVNARPLAPKAWLKFRVVNRSASRVELNAVTVTQ